MVRAAKSKSSRSSRSRSSASAEGKSAKDDVQSATATNGGDGQELADAESLELEAVGNPWLAVLCAWLVPGAGHFYLQRKSRGLIFFAVVVSFVLLGVDLEGELVWSFESGLRIGATLASMGSGIAYGVLHFVLGYEGRILAPGYEYGSAFLLSAGLMNWLLMLDARDIALGRKP